MLFVLVGGVRGSLKLFISLHRFLFRIRPEHNDCFIPYDLPIRSRIACDSGLVNSLQVEKQLDILLFVQNFFKIMFLQNKYRLSLLDNSSAG